MNKTLMSMFALSAVWIISILIFLNSTESCPSDVNQELYKYLSKYLSCRTPNELGDFLAGAFAPLAFIWLAGAVYIQSQELSAQRSELKLTRKELEQQRIVMQKQAEEMKASTGFIKQQTSILKDEQTTREQQAADREFYAIIGSLNLEVKRQCDYFIEFEQIMLKKTNKKGQILSEFPNEYDLLVDHGGSVLEIIFDDLRELPNKLEDSCKPIYNTRKVISSAKLSENARESLNRISNNITNLIEMTSTLSAETRVTADTLRLEDVKNALDKFFSNFEGFSRREDVIGPIS